MKACLAGPSALYWWLSQKRTDIEIQRAHLPALFVPDYSVRDVRLLLDAYGANGKLYLAAPSASSRARTAGATELLLGENAHRPLFSKIDRNVWVCAPELAALQSIRYESDIRAIFLMCKLTAASFESGNGAKTESSFTSLEAIKKLLPSSRNLCPSKRAERIVDLSAENAASIREIQAYMMLCLPKRLGGYGLPKPKLNGAIAVPSSLGLEEGTLHGDMVWENERVILEYESRKHHANAYQLEVDSRRRAIFANEGYAVFTMTNNQLIYEAESDRLANALSKALGKRFYRADEATEERRRALRKEVLSLEHQ